MMALKPVELQNLCKYMGHTQDVHLNTYRTTMDIIENTQITKFMLIVDQGLIGKYRDKCLADIPLEGNYYTKTYQQANLGISTIMTLCI